MIHPTCACSARACTPPFSAGNNNGPQCCATLPATRPDPMPPPHRPDNKTNKRYPRLNTNYDKTARRLKTIGYKIPRDAGTDPRMVRFLHPENAAAVGTQLIPLPTADGTCSGAGCLVVCRCCCCYCCYCCCCCWRWWWCGGGDIGGGGGGGGRGGGVVGGGGWSCWSCWSCQWCLRWW